MATGAYSVAHPTNYITAGTVPSGLIITDQAYADICETVNSLGQTLTGAAKARSWRGLVIDGTGGNIVTPGARTITVAGGNLSVSLEPGNTVVFNRAVQIQSAGLDVTGGITSNDDPVTVKSSTMSLTTGSVVVTRASANGTIVGYEILATVQTTNATTTTVYTFPLPSSRAAHVVTSAVGMKTDATQAAGYYLANTYRNNAGTITAVTGSPSDLHTAHEDDAAWVGLAVAPSGTDLLVRVEGKAATTINWTIWTRITLAGA